MKRTTIFMVLISLLFSLCTEKDATKEKTAQTTTSLPALQIPLSDMQIEACNSANEGGTCKTKLPTVDIVTIEECCKYLNKCCE